jgi:hypothetical protein
VGGEELFSQVCEWAFFNRGSTLPLSKMELVRVKVYQSALGLMFDIVKIPANLFLGWKQWIGVWSLFSITGYGR